MPISGINIPVARGPAVVPAPAGAGGARVDFEITTNAYWDDAFQFGTPGDTSWSFTGVTFEMELKATPTSSAALTLSSGSASIVVTDVVNRLMNFFVTDTALAAAFTTLPSEYLYDLVMITTATGQKDILMHGKVCVFSGITT